MLALEPILQARLRSLPAFTGWQVRGATQDTDRRAVPAVDVRMGGASVPQVRRPAATLQPEWTVTLAVSRGPDAAGQLDRALTAAIEALHNWVPTMPPEPGQPAPRKWTELQVAQVLPADFIDVGRTGYQITFTTASVFNGQP